MAEAFCIFPSISAARRRAVGLGSCRARVATFKRGRIALQPGEAGLFQTEDFQPPGAQGIDQGLAIGSAHPPDQKATNQCDHHTHQQDLGRQSAPAHQG